MSEPIFTYRTEGLDPGATDNVAAGSASAAALKALRSIVARDPEGTIAFPFDIFVVAAAADGMPEIDGTLTGKARARALAAERAAKEQAAQADLGELHFRAEGPDVVNMLSEV